MKVGRFFISTGFYKSDQFWQHQLVAFHRRWRLEFVRPHGKPSYRRLYLGPLEIEWSKSTARATSGAYPAGRAALEKETRE